MSFRGILDKDPNSGLGQDLLLFTKAGSFKDTLEFRSNQDSEVFLCEKYPDGNIFASSMKGVLLSQLKQSWRGPRTEQATKN